jgi:hypothetical protein
MKKYYQPTLCAAVMVLAASTAQADNDNRKFALGIGAGTTGYSISGTFNLSKTTNIRAIYASYDDTLNETSSGIDYVYDLDLSTTSLLLDWHPFKGSFRLSIGAVNNGNEYRATASQNTGSITVGNQTFSTAQLGTLRAEVDTDSVAPYLGIGWGNAVSNKGGALSFSADIGVIFQGDPTVTLTTEGTDAAIQSQVTTQLAIEKEQLEDDLNDFKFYPVINLGLGYRF